jgi:hypothetical protein
MPQRLQLALIVKEKVQDLLTLRTQFIQRMVSFSASETVLGVKQNGGLNKVQR